jgi:hypothetical protein
VSVPPLPAALAAFLRGIEPRARVLARAQAGPSLDDERLLAEVRDEFAGRAPRLPLAEWPLRYWGLLLARQELAQPSGPTPAHPLYRLSHTRRLALLLRLVVGLEPPGAARVLGLSETAYRALWTDAEDKLAELGVGPAVLMRWNEGFQQEVRAGGGDSTGSRVSTASSASSPRLPQRAPRWRPTALQWSLGAVALLLLAVFAATFVWTPAELAAPRAGAPDAAPAALDAAPAPEARRDLDADLVVDPDFALLASPSGEPWRDGVGFLAWLASERGIALPPPPAADALPVTRPWAALPAEAQTLLAPVRAAWPALDGAAQQALLDQAEAWRASDLARREALRAAYAEWLALPALQRSAQRAAHAEWQALDAGEKTALVAAAAELAAQPDAQRAALRAAFAALDPALQQDWALGPRLGRQLPGLRPLLLHLPAAEEAALVEALEALDETARAALAERIAAMGAAERAALRGRVLAVPAPERAALFVEAATAR